MRILYLHRTQGGGVEGVHIAGIARAFRELGHEVTIWPPLPEAPSRHDEGARRQGLVRRFLSRLARHTPEWLFELLEIGFNLPTCFAAWRIRRRAGPFDMVYERLAFFAWAGSRIARSWGVPHIVEVNYLTSSPLVRKRCRALLPIARRVERGVVLNATLLSVISSRLIADLGEFEGLAADRVILTPNAVDDEEFATPSDGGVVRERLRIAGNRVVLGFVGGFYPWHGTHRLVEVLERVVTRDGIPAICALLVGDGPERARVVALVEERGHAESFRFPGAVPRADLLPYLAAMDIVVIPHSNDYGSPMKMFEYLAAGKIGVFPRLSPIEDVVRDGVEALLFDPHEEGSFESVLERAVRERESLAGVAAEGRRKVLAEHTWRRNAERVLAALDQRAASRDEGPAGPAPTGD